ncbi:MAG TPA: hypothetical protein VHD55_00240, partial [Candidatus Paceibacterota bacterium]|nr:hypothetical protein [Candidatus Paceibacterota bacterium]
MENLIATARQNIGAIAKLSGGAAFLVAVALVAGGTNLKHGGLGAATMTFGASTLTITAASNTVQLGNQTTISWNASVPLTCFGNVSTGCGKTSSFMANI